MLTGYLTEIAHCLIENYFKLVSKLVFKNQKCYPTWDYNINLLNYDSHADTEECVNKIFSHFQYRVITRPTHFSPTSSTLIDNIFVNNINDVYYSGYHTSENLPIFYISNDIVESKYICKKITKLNKEMYSQNINLFC